jgi:hypothetical protein
MTNTRSVPLRKEVVPFSGLEDPIPGPETIGPSLNYPDEGVYQHEVDSDPSSSRPE